MRVYRILINEKDQWVYEVKKGEIDTVNIN